MSNFLSQSDFDNYGTDLVDFSQRSALQAVVPHLQQIANSHAELEHRLAREARYRMDQQVEKAIPNYREIDRDPNWHRWLLGTDSLSGRQRQQLLNDAISAGDATRAISFFRGFQREQGHSESNNNSNWTNNSRSVHGQIYTREQIAKLYRQNQQGAYRGREAEWQRQEADIIAAGREGRIVGGVDLHGK